MEMDKEKFMEKLKGLMEMGKKKKNTLEYHEIQSYFQDMPISDDQMDKVLEYLEAHGIDVLRISENGTMWMICFCLATTTSIWMMKKKWIWRI